MSDINESLARKVLEVVDAGLVHGMGVPKPGKMCVEAAVNYAMGKPHGDNPDCVAPTLRRLKIRLNDSRWSSDATRTKGLRRLAIAQLGSAGTLDEKEFVRRLVHHALSVSVPSALRAAASVAKQSHLYALLLAAENLEKEPTREKALEAKSAAASCASSAASCAGYAVDAAGYAVDATYAANAYAYAATSYAAYAASSAASSCASSAAYAAAYAASCAASCAAYERDRSLAEYCEWVVQLLIELKAPGTQWLFLTEETT